MMEIGEAAYQSATATEPEDDGVIDVEVEEPTAGAAV